MYGAGGGGGGGQTPMYGGATGGQTPLYGAGAGSQTPYYGSGGVGAQTPFYGAGGQTPLYGGAAAAAAPATGAAAADDGAAAPGEENEVPWYAAGVRVDVISGPHKGKSGVVAAVLAGSLSVILDGGGAQQVSIALAAGRPQPAKQGEPCRFVRGEYAGQRGTVVSESDDGDLVVKVGEGADSDQGRPDIVTADAVVRMAR